MTQPSTAHAVRGEIIVLDVVADSLVIAVAGAFVWPLAFYVTYRFDIGDMRRRLVGKRPDRRFYGAFAAFGFAAGGLLTFSDLALSLTGMAEVMRRLALILIAVPLIIALALFLDRRQR